MIYFCIQGDAVVATAKSYAERDTSVEGEWVSRSDKAMSTMEQCESIAAGVAKLTGIEYIAIDNGSNVWPRYDVIKAPKVGEDVSYAFNGDYYPDGQISSISKSLRVIQTSTGGKYYRRGQTGRWVKKGGTWSLVHGHHTDKNPHF